MADNEAQEMMEGEQLNAQTLIAVQRNRIIELEDNLTQALTIANQYKSQVIALMEQSGSVDKEIAEEEIINNKKEIKSIKEFTGTEELDLKKDWYEAFQNVEQEEKDYLLGLLEAGEDLEKPARIWTSTIHAIKGGEQDNVILCLDMGDKILKAIKRSQDKEDEEHRVWYVGVTRAKNNLYKLKAKIYNRGYKI